PKTDPGGWQRPMEGAESAPERSEGRQRSLAPRNGRARAVTAAAADTSRGACLASHRGAARSGGRGKPKRGGPPLSRRRVASTLWLRDGRAESQKHGYPQGGHRDADERAGVLPCARISQPPRDLPDLLGLEARERRRS